MTENENENIHESFLKEDERCSECGMFPPDHDQICPYNPELSQSTPEDVLKELKEKLTELECSPEPDFEAIGDILAQIESVKTHCRE